jgi:hypothetical protein
MSDSYHKKYLKYKNKYLNLKHQLGGDRRVFERVVREFFNTHIDEFLNTMYFKAYIYTKFISKTKQFDVFNINADEKAIILRILNIEMDNIVVDLIQFCVILSELGVPNSIDDKIKSGQRIINIFSYATGNGFVEALFAIYLRIMRAIEEVNIITFDPFTELGSIIGYFANGIRVFNVIVNLFDEMKIRGQIDYDRNIRDLILLHRGEINHELEQFREKIINRNVSNIDIFFALNPQAFNYNRGRGPNGEERFNQTVMILNLYINLLIPSKELQKQVPMLWLFFNEQLDFWDYSTLNRSLIKQNGENYKKFTEVYPGDYGERLVLFSISSLDNLYRFANFREDQQPKYLQF